MLPMGDIVARGGL